MGRLTVHLRRLRLRSSPVREARLRAVVSVLCCPRSAMSGLRRWLAPRTVVRAHCDIPCGVYDPQQARIEAESCYKIIQKYNDSQDELFRTRCIAVKEERADLAKHHI